MRSTIVKGTDDGIRIDLGGNTDIIGEIINIGKAVDYLIFEAEMTGAELWEFSKKFHVENKIPEEIKAENRYILTAFDW